MSIFVNYEGIRGESSDPNHREWMDAESISFGVSREITSRTSTRGDRESSNAEISGVLIKKLMDKSTPKVFIESCCGTGKKVKIHLTKTGKGSGTDVFMEYTLKNALISHYQVEADIDDIGRPIEKFFISFVDLELKYTAFDEDGNALAPQAVGFDTSTNMKK